MSKALMYMQQCSCSMTMEPKFLTSVKSICLNLPIFLLRLKAFIRIYRSWKLRLHIPSA